MIPRPGNRVGRGAADDPEALRARVALDHVRRTGRASDAGDAGATTPVGREWRALRRRRRLRTLRRSVAWIVSGALLAGVVTGSLLGGRSAFAWLRGNTDLFRVKSVAVTGLARLTDAEVLEAASLRVGQDILALEPDSIRVAIERLPRVRQATVERRWTREVRVAVEERKPEALLVLRDTWEIDADGVLLPPDRDGRLADLPLIVGLPPDSAVAGSAPRAPGVADGVAVAGRLRSTGLADAVSEIDIAKPDSLVMILQPDGVPVRLGDGKIPERRFLALQGVMNDLAQNEIEAEYIDLRFAGMAAVMPIQAAGETRGMSLARVTGVAVPARKSPAAATVRPAAPKQVAKSPAARVPPKSRAPGNGTLKKGKPGAAKSPASKDPRRPNGKRA